MCVLIQKESFLYDNAKFSLVSAILFLCFGFLFFGTTSLSGSLSLVINKVSLDSTKKCVLQLYGEKDYLWIIIKLYLDICRSTGMMKNCQWSSYVQSQ